MICDITPVPDQPPAAKLSWRVILGVATILFWLTNSLFVRGGYYEYHGYTTNTLVTISEAVDSGIEIEGPLDFVYRTQMVLGLLKERSPAYYFRVGEFVTSIKYLGPNYLTTADGKKISLEDIGAMASPQTGEVHILYSTAFPRGPAEFVDYDIFSYAGILIHEMRHIELHASGQDPGGWQEEQMCEEAAYDCLAHMDAPGGVLSRYDLYLSDPTNKRYQKWYDWYKQW